MGRGLWTNYQTTLPMSDRTMEEVADVPMTGFVQENRDTVSVATEGKRNKARNIKTKYFGNRNLARGELPSVSYEKTNSRVGIAQVGGGTFYEGVIEFATAGGVTVTLTDAPGSNKTTVTFQVTSSVPEKLFFALNLR